MGREGKAGGEFSVPRGNNPPRSLSGGKEMERKKKEERMKQRSAKKKRKGVAGPNCRRPVGED